MAESELPVSTLNEFQASLLWLANHVEQIIIQEGSSGPEAAFRGLREGTRAPRPNIDTVGKADTYQNHVVICFARLSCNLKQ